MDPEYDDDDYATPESEEDPEEHQQRTMDELNRRIQSLENLKQSMTKQQAVAGPAQVGPAMSYSTAVKSPASQSPARPNQPQVKSYYTSHQAAANAHQPGQTGVAEPTMQFSFDNDAVMAETDAIIKQIDQSLTPRTDYQQPGPSSAMSNQIDYDNSVEVSLTPEQAEFEEVMHRTAKKHANDSKLRKGKKK
jgi:hypothetical protein